VKPAYTLRDLAFSYGGPPVLDLRELEIADGEILALVGPNGSGKTTLLHLLAFIESPASGTISLMGERLTRENVLAFRRRVGLLLQQPYLFNTTVKANVMLGLRVRGVPRSKARAKALAALDKVGLSGFENRYARFLSGGESQRLALARALVLDPEVLLLDEPANHMDKTSVQMTEEIFLELNRSFGKTVIFTTHNLLQGRKLAHRVLSLFRGKLLSASSENLFKGRLAPDGFLFHTAGLSITLPVRTAEGSYVTIDPTRIALSRNLSDQSRPNRWQGRIVALAEENGEIRVEVDAGERLCVFVTHETADLLCIGLGHQVWLTVEGDGIAVLS